MSESVLQEADRLVDGDRQGDYGHPADDFAKTAKMLTGVLMPKLRPGVEVSAVDVALIMCCVKISREVNRHKRDNIVDLAGYAKTLWMVRQRQEELDDQGDAVKAIKEAGPFVAGETPRVRNRCQTCYHEHSPMTVGSRCVSCVTTTTEHLTNWEPKSCGKD